MKPYTIKEVWKEAYGAARGTQWPCKCDLLMSHLAEVVLKQPRDLLAVRQNMVQQYGIMNRSIWFHTTTETMKMARNRRKRDHYSVACIGVPSNWNEKPSYLNGKTKK